MFQKKPRPTQLEFTDAVFRATSPEQYYPPWFETSFIAHALKRVAQTLAFRPPEPYPGRLEYSQRRDIEIIRNEQLAEGYVPGEEDLMVFGTKQVERYKQLK